MPKRQVFFFFFLFFFIKSVTQSKDEIRRCLGSPHESFVSHFSLHIREDATRLQFFVGLFVCLFVCLFFFKFFQKNVYPPTLANIVISLMKFVHQSLLTQRRSYNPLFLARQSNFQLLQMNSSCKRSYRTLRKLFKKFFLIDEEI